MQHVKAAHSTKERNSSIKSAWETLGGPVQGMKNNILGIAHGQLNGYSLKSIDAWLREDLEINVIMNEEPNTTASPLKVWNIGTFVAWQRDICNEAVSVIWS